MFYYLFFWGGEGFPYPKKRRTRATREKNYNIYIYICIYKEDIFGGTGALRVDPGDPAPPGPPPPPPWPSPGAARLAPSAGSGAKRAASSEQVAPGSPLFGFRVAFFFSRKTKKRKWSFWLDVGGVRFGEREKTPAKRATGGLLGSRWRIGATWMEENSENSGSRPGDSRCLSGFPDSPTKMPTPNRRSHRHLYARLPRMESSPSTKSTSQHANMKRQRLQQVCVWFQAWFHIVGAVRFGARHLVDRAGETPLSHQNQANTHSCSKQLLRIEQFATRTLSKMRRAIRRLSPICLWEMV